jgi:hypothetical protein
MALAGVLTYGGSGRFVPDRAWSCPKHDYPQYHECDCGHCPVGEWECDECATASWADQFNEDGTRKMRELSVAEAFLAPDPSVLNEAKHLFVESVMAQMLADVPKGGTEVMWQEDINLPIVRGDEPQE